MRQSGRSVYHWNGLLAGLLKDGLYDQAAQLFYHGMPVRDVVSWNTMAAYHAQKGGNLEATAWLFSCMPARDLVSWNTVLAAYAQRGQVQQACDAFSNMPDKDVASWNVILGAFAGAGYATDAGSTFSGMPRRNIISWTALLSAYAQTGHLKDADLVFYRAPQWDLVSFNAALPVQLRTDLRQGFGFFDWMPQRNRISWIAVVQTCGCTGDVAAAVAAYHRMPCWDAAGWNSMVVTYAENGCTDEAAAMVAASGPMSLTTTASWNSVIQAYSRSGRATMAREVFDAMQRRDAGSWRALHDPLTTLELSPMHDLATWNSALAALVQQSRLDEARRLFDQLPERSTATWNTMVAAVAATGAVDEARAMLGAMPVQPPPVTSWTVVLLGYAAAGRIGSAKEAFDEAGPGRDAVCWNALLKSYSAFGSDMATAELVFDRMAGWSSCSLNVLLQGYLDRGQPSVAVSTVNSWGTTIDQSTWSLLLGACARTHQLDSVARPMLGRMPATAGVATWNALLGAYADIKLPAARAVLDRMPATDELSWNLMVAGYVQAELVEQARLVLEQSPCRAVVAKNTVMSAYVQAGQLGRARAVFDDMEERSTVSWNTIIHGYAKSSFSAEALYLFAAMDLEGTRPDAGTFIAGLQACAGCGSGEATTRLLHGELGSELLGKASVATALLTAYGSCGKMDRAREAFEGVAEPRDAVCWTALMTALSSNGGGEEAVTAFLLMAQEGTRPDAAAFLAVLSACNHAGLVSQARSILLSMSDYGDELAACPEHYTCMIGLLGRAGRLGEAEEIAAAIGNDGGAERAALLGAGASVERLLDPASPASFALAAKRNKFKFKIQNPKCSLSSSRERSKTMQGYS